MESIVVSTLVGFAAMNILSQGTLNALDQLVATLIALTGAVVTTVVWRLVEKYLPGKGEKHESASESGHSQVRPESTGEV